MTSISYRSSSNLTLSYCKKYHVRLFAEKTKLLAFFKPNSEYGEYSKLVKPIHFGDTNIKFVSSAEHVGVDRSTAGNMPHILQRITTIITLLMSCAAWSLAHFIGLIPSPPYMQRSCMLHLFSSLEWQHRS